MLIIISLIILIALFIFLTYIFYDNDFGFVTELSGVLIGFLFIILILCSIGCILPAINITANETSLAQEQQIIEYKVNHLNHFLLSYNTTIDDIKEWNEKISGCQIKHESLWLNWFYPVDYSQFKTFELK